MCRVPDDTNIRPGERSKPLARERTRYHLASQHVFQAELLAQELGEGAEWRSRCGWTWCIAYGGLKLGCTGCHSRHGVSIKGRCNLRRPMEISVVCREILEKAGDEDN